MEYVKLLFINQKRYNCFSYSQYFSYTKAETLWSLLLLYDAIMSMNMSIPGQITIISLLSAQA